MELFKSLPAGGSIQITEDNGYFFALRHDEYLDTEFRSGRDPEANKVRVSLPEVKGRLDAVCGALLV